MNKQRLQTRARDLGWLPHSLLAPGQHNAITDVPDVLVGHTTLNRGHPGPLVVGQGPIRTGVTAIIPKQSDLYREKVTGAVFVQNGFGKTLGLPQIHETGAIETPILLTNTFSVWKAADGLVDWAMENYRSFRLDKGASINPVVGECNDGYLNDLRGRHIHKEHVFTALANAAGGPVTEGSVGGGTGLRAFGFKAGIGTASRIIPVDSKDTLVVGALVQANFGKRNQLLIRGQAVGLALEPWAEKPVHEAVQAPEQGSCMIILATNAPLSSRQLGRLARRASMGLARTGGVSGHGSGEIVIALSNTNLKREQGRFSIQTLDRISPEGTIFDQFAQAVVESVEEAILNSLVSAETMSGRDNNICPKIPLDKIAQLLPPPVLENDHRDLTS